MPRPRLPHLQRETSRHGRPKWYVRLARGPRIRLPDDYGSPQFMAAYRRALEQGAPPKPPRAALGTLGWLIQTYLQSAEWAATAKETRKQFTYQFNRMVERAGDAALADITRADIIESRDARAATPSDANKFVKATRKIFAWAVERGHMASNPAEGVKKLALPNAAEGFRAWEADELAAFEARWPVGTRERLAYDLLLYTGLRRSDAVRLGRQHVRDGVFSIKTGKTGAVVTAPVLPPLARSIAKTPTGDLAFLATLKGTPFTRESFGTWFGKACRAAGVEGSAHGLRKAGAARAAEQGATEAQLNALFGWADGSRESATYTKKAGRARLAKDGAKLLILPHPGKPPPAPRAKR